MEATLISERRVSGRTRDLRLDEPRPTSTCTPWTGMRSGAVGGGVPPSASHTGMPNEAHLGAAALLPCIACHGSECATRLRRSGSSVCSRLPDMARERVCVNVGYM